jgi:broad specificity phosphatase PhoE
MLLYLIRHAKSFANASKIQNGTESDSLTNEGIEQAFLLAKFLEINNINASRYITSTWKRAQQTADILFPCANWEVDSRVGETNAGDVSGMLTLDFNLKYPDLLEHHENRFPGGESHSDLNNRVRAWLLDLESSTNVDEKVICVCHSGSISCILQIICEIRMEKFPAFLVPNCSLTYVQYSSKEEKVRQNRINILGMVPDSQLSRINFHEQTRWP